MNKDIGKYGNKFTSTNQPNNRGRKPKLYSIAKKVYRITVDEWRDVTLFLMPCTKSEVEEIANDAKTPIWVANICRALYKDTGKGVTYTLQEIMTRLWGSPGKNIDITSGGKEMRGLTIEVKDSDTADRLRKLLDGQK